MGYQDVTRSAISSRLFATFDDEGLTGKSTYRQLEQLRRPEGTRDDLTEPRVAPDGGRDYADPAERVGLGAVALSPDAGSRTTPGRSGYLSAGAVPNNLAGGRHRVLWSAHIR